MKKTSRDSISLERRTDVSLLMEQLKGELKYDMEQLKSEMKHLQEMTDMKIKTNSDDSLKNLANFHAAKVFQDPPIGMLSSIILTKSKCKRCFRVCVLALCISGFLYQSITYMNHVLEYPTVMSIAVERPENLIAPAYTFCTNNPVKRSVFCSRNSSYCTMPSEEFCKKFEPYCGNSKTLVPKEEYYDVKESMSFKDILEYGDKDFFVRNSKNVAFLRGAYIQNYYRYGVLLCYSMYSVVESNQEPKQTKRKIVSTAFGKDYLAFQVNESEMMQPGIDPVIRFAVHSPFDAVNMYDTGIHLKRGREYLIQVKMEEEILLKYPFGTNCKDYEELWGINNHTGPRTKKMCHEKCELDYYLTIYNCVLTRLLYPSVAKLCEEGYQFRSKYSGILSEAMLKNRECHDNCLDDCRLLKYSPDVIESERQTIKAKSVYGENKLLVRVKLPNAVTIMKHSPKYERVEVFSNIGGFIGMWLGITLTDMIDVIASIVTVFSYTFTKK